jgi:multidrug efflux system outer membrane protein
MNNCLIPSPRTGLKSQVNLVASAMAFFLLSGCSLAPVYVRPAAPVASSFPAGPSAISNGGANATASSQAASDVGWRDFFTDPRLQKLIALALENNRDLRSAALRIEESRALHNIQSADRLPNLNGVAGGSRARNLSFLNGNSQTAVSTNYQVGLSLTSFELDFFGRVRSLSDAALAQYLATTEARQSIRITVIASVAQAYLIERGYAEQLVIAKNTTAGRQTGYDLAKQRFDVGASSALDLRLAETLLLSAKVATVTLARQQAQAFNALIVLVGTPPVDLPAAQSLSSETIVTGIPPGLPSDLLANRPDIRAAEQRLKAANANIGAARAAFFPRISLTAGFGTASNELSGLFDTGSRTWSFTPQLLLPIFDAGRNRASLSLAKVRSDLAVADYEKTIQVAFREVADALVARGTLDEQVVAQQAFLDAQTDRLRLADLRYKNGVASSLDQLDAQRELFSAQQSLVQARVLRLTNAVDIYRSLGGGLLEQSVPNATK